MTPIEKQKKLRLAIAFIAMRLFAEFENIKPSNKFEDKHGEKYSIVSKLHALHVKKLNDALLADNEFLEMAGVVTPSFVSSAKVMENDELFITKENWLEQVKSHMYDVWQAGCKLEGFHQRLFFQGCSFGLRLVNEDHCSFTPVDDDIVYGIMIRIIDGAAVDVFE